MSFALSLRRPLIAIDLIVLAICCAGIVHIHQKPGAGVSLREEDGAVVCDAVTGVPSASPLRPGDRIVALGGAEIRFVEDVEFILDGRRIGEPIHAAIEREGRRLTVLLTLVPYYGTAYLIIVIAVSALFFAVGAIVHIRRPADRAAAVYHYASLGTAVMLSTTWGQFAPPPSVLGIALRVVFSAMYAFVPVLFFQFTRVFPHERGGPRRHILHGVLHAVAFLLALVNGFTFIRAAVSGLVADFHTHLTAFTVTRIFLVTLVLAGLVTIRQAYWEAGEEPDRRRLRWVVWGLFAGFFPFVMLWVVPSIILSYPLVPEEVMLAASGAIPVAFGISIVRYHIMDIDLLLNRSVVYAVVMSVLVVAYAAVVGGAATLVTSLTYETSAIVSGVAAILMALAFEPLRRVVQNVVDRRYFRVRYNYRREGRELLDRIKQAPSLESLGSDVVTRLAHVIPAERMALLTADEQAPGFTVLAQTGPDNGGYPEQAQDLWDGGRIPLAVPDLMEPGLSYAQLPARVRERWGLVLAIPLVSKDERLIGLFVCGPKRSGTRFTSEDADLLTTVCASAAMEIERIRLVRELVRKQEEAGRLEVLNGLKSDFVSYVSHDLRTPLTSIKMYAELLRTRLRPRDRKVRDYLGVIQGEADRLNRMVTTILDSARIEEGAVQYAVKRVDLKRIIRSVVRLMDYQFRKEGFRVTLSLPPGRTPLPLDADPDAVREALINLLTNAMKYSGDQRVITVTAGRKGREVFCTVTDRGSGIETEALPHLFEKFYRAPSRSGRIQGVGIGLSVVKHIMDAHDGRVDVSSEPGTGSSFTLIFPQRPSQTRNSPHETHSRR